MSRSIRFRAWNDDTKEMFQMGKFSLEAYTPDGEEYWLNAPSFNEHGDYNELILMQFTGLKDKNGKEIYEGDLLDFDADEWNAEFIRENAREFVVEVVPPISKFIWGWPLCGHPRDVSRWRQVVGNIHETPELKT